MGDVPPDLFDRLPEDVTQIIFGAIYDCKSLVRCMAVSQAFYRHAVRISSLSIVCPDNYSSYEEKLKKIYSMVKGFRELQTLVVRVGQPKDEPATWARCMRYAEIGASVEKFMFMAAKSGDFSELDCALADSDCASETNIFQGSAAQNGTEKERRDQSSDIESENKRYHETSRSGNINSSETENIPSCGTSESRLGKAFQNATLHSGLTWSLFLQRRLHIRGCPRIGQLSDFNLRQVIAPSNDVMRRMIPVIHFAILQGLNEFRDVVPSFVAKFPQLNRFLLVDLLESVTIHLRQHHLEEIRSFHVQDVADWECNRFVREDILSKNSNVQNSLVHDSSINLSLNEQDSPETPAHSQSAVTSHENTEVQDLESKSLEDGFVALGNCCERSDLGQLCEVSKWKFGSSVENNLDHEVNPSILKAMGRRIESEDLDIGKNLEAEVKVEKRLRKAKGLLEDIPESTEQGGQNLEFVHGKSESENCGYSTESTWNGNEFLHTDSNTDGVCPGSFQVYVQKDTVCFQAERAHSSCGCEDSHSLFHGHPDRFCKSMGDKSYPTPCQSGILHDNGEGSKPESLCDSEGSYSHFNDPSKNRLINSHRTSSGAESSHRVRAFEKLMERRGYENRTGPVEGGWEDMNSHVNKDANKSRTETGGHLLNVTYNEGWDGSAVSLHREITGDGCTESLHGENEGDRQEPYRHRISRFQDIFKDGKVDIANRYPFKRGSKNDSLRSRDSGRNLKTGSFITLDDSASSSESLRNKDEGLSQGSEVYRRRGVQFQRQNELQDDPQISGPMKLKSLEDSTVNLYPLQEPLNGIYSECSSSQRPVDFSFQQNSTLKDSLNIEVDKHSFAEHKFDGSHLVLLQDEKVSKNKQACLVAPMNNVVQKRSDQEENGKEESSNSCLTISGSVRANQDRTGDDRFTERGPWKETWRERVRRSRDARRDARIQEDERRDRESQRRARNAFQRRRNDLEKEALSFDYSFWRAEQVVAQNYRLSDVSMCIATYSAKPLGESDIEILSYAALAGPLLAATVSHVNKQHSSHNL